MSRNSNSKSMRDRCLYVGEYFFDDLRIIRLLRLQGGDNMCSLYLRAFSNAMEAGGAIVRDQDLSPEEQIVYMLRLPDSRIPDVAAMLQTCREYKLIVDDGKTIDFEGCWDLP